MIRTKIPCGDTVSACLSIFLLAALLGLGMNTASAASPASNSKLNVLLITGGHSYDVAEFDTVFKADPDIEYTHLEHPQALPVLASPEAKKFDAIVLYDLYQTISDEQKKAYTGLILQGKGLVVLHHAIANFQDWPEYARMIGGKYYTAPHVVNGVETPASTYQHDVELPVGIADPAHFITRSLSRFTIHDEAYNGFDVDPADHILLRAYHPASGPVIGWTKPYGKGRVVYIELGHDAQAYRNPNYPTLVYRAIRWVARQTPEDTAFKPIFNGRDLAGWKPIGNATWTVEDGMLVGRQGPGEAAGDLLTEADYGDFDMEVTWTMDWPGNSGIWFRYANADKAYQADILEWKNPVCWSGSLYCSGKMFIAMNKDESIVRRNGWNTFFVRAQNNHLLLFLNGHQVADVQDSSSARGKIGIQVHPGAEFANMAIRIADIRIRPLD
ncbi:MAG: DUF1080 domain-containing protein [Candidatus Omnitrophica bacterium]|nr:DUF1080 domain-containing protein [Candidatus Omnitrophota bacterium]